MQYPEYLYEFQCMEESLKADRNLKLLIGLLAFVLGIWLGAWMTNHFAWVWLAVTFAILFGAFRLLFDVIQFWQPRSTQIMQLLHNQPTEIVWVYYVVTQKLPFGIQFSHKATMYIWLMEKDCITLKLNEKDVKPVYECLYDLLPHASFGYSQEKEQWYMANPAMLLRD